MNYQQSASSASYPFMHVTATVLASAIPHAQLRRLPGQTHEVEAEALAPVLEQFFNFNAAERVIHKGRCDLRQFMAILVKQIVAALLVQKPV